MTENNKKRQEIKDRGRLLVKLTRKQIGILKAALQYYGYADEFGLALSTTSPFHSYGSANWEYSQRVTNLIVKLNQASKTKIKEDFGYFGSLDLINNICQNVYKKAKWAGERVEEQQNRLCDAIKQQLKIICPECNYVNDAKEIELDWSKPKYKGWYYLKCAKGHTINQHPQLFLPKKETNKYPSKDIKSE